MTMINSNFESNFNAIFFGENGVERKGVPVDKNGSLKKFYTTSLDRHDKSNIIFQVLVKVLHVDDYDRKKVLFNITQHLSTKSLDLRSKITTENYGQFKDDLIKMSTALAKNLDNNHDLETIISLVDGLNPNSSAISTGSPSTRPVRSEPLGIPSALNASVSTLGTNDSSPNSSRSNQAWASSPLTPQRPRSLQENFKAVEDILKKNKLDSCDPVLINMYISDILNDESFRQSNAYPRLIALLETYLNRVVPQNPNGTISEQIIALDAHIKEAKEIATMIVPHSPTSKQWTLKIQDLENQHQHLLKSTQKAMDQAGEKFLPTLHRLINDKLNTADQALLQMQTLHGDLGIKSPMSPDISTAFASLTHETTEQLKLAQENHRHIADEANSSLQTEKYQLESTKRLIANAIEKTTLYQSAATYHHGDSQSITQDAFHNLSLQISLRKEELANCKAEIADKMDSIIPFRRGQVPGLRQKQRELELEILTLEQKRLNYDYKLLVQKFTKESLPILERIQKIAETEYPGEGNLAQLKLEIAAYTQKCNELQKDLDIIKKGMSSNKSEIDQLHSTVLKQTGLAEGFLKKIESLKNTVEHDIRNFTSLEERLKKEMDVSAVASHYERRIETGKRTIQLLQQKEVAEGKFEQAKNNQKALTEIQKLIKWQADYVVRITAIEVSPKGTTPYENFLIAFAIDARARHIPEDQWAGLIVERLEKHFIISEVHKPLLTDNLNKALGQMGLIKVSLPEHRKSF